MNPIDAADATRQKAFDQGFICGLVLFYTEFPYSKDQVRQILSFGGFMTLDKALAAHPDEYDVRKLREIYGVDEDD